MVTERHEEIKTVEEFEEEAAGFQLKAVVKDGAQEGPVLSASYCRCETSPSCDNLVAVLTKNHLTVYDDFHWGDHVAIVAQYVDDVARMVCMSWIPGESESERHRLSPRIALAKSDGSLEIMSIINSKITSRIQIGEDVAEIAAPGAWGSCGRELLAVRTAQGLVTLWDVSSKECVGRVCEDGSAVAFAGDGNALFVARQDGSVQMYDVLSLPLKEALVLGCGGEIVKKIVPVHDSGSLVLSRPSSFQLWNLKNESYTSEWALKGYREQSERPCGVNDTHAILGTDDGDGHVYSLENGAETCVVSVVRVASEIEAAALSVDGSHLVLAAGNGFLFRFLQKK